MVASIVAGLLISIEKALVCCVRANLYRNVADAGAMILVNLPILQAAGELESYSNIFRCDKLFFQLVRYIWNAGSRERVFS